MIEDEMSINIYYNKNEKIYYYIFKINFVFLISWNLIRGQQ